MKRRTSIIVCLLLGSFFVSSSVFSANTDVVITEIGAYESGNHEWIEVWNKGSETVDLTGWKFWENNTNHSLSVSTTDFILNADEYGVIVQDAAQFLLDYPFFAGSVFDSSWSSLNESGEEIGIKDAQGNLIEQFTYISAPDFSLQRIGPFLADYSPTNWAQHSTSNTVGFVNNFAVAQTSTASTTPTPPPQGGEPQTTSTIPGPSLSTTSTATSTYSNTGEQNTSSGSNSQSTQPTLQDLSPIKINEIIADPGDNNEWVELYNTSNASIDITNALICDSRNTTSTCKKLIGSIAARSWLRVDLQTKSFLNNSGDSVILKDSLGRIIDRIDYEDDLTPNEDQSLARRVDGVDADSDADWVVTNSLSPGAANIIISNETEIQHPTSTQQTTSSTAKISTGKAIKKPTSVFAGDIIAPASAGINEVVTYNAEGLADPRGGTLSFVWTLENGEQVHGPEIKTSFFTSGPHSVTIFVTSTSGYGEERKIETTVGGGLSIHAGIIISELLPNPDGEDSAEFIEIKNNTAAPVNLGGWQLRIQDKTYTFLENTTIVSGGFLIFYKSVTKLNLVNTTGRVELLNTDKTVVDLVAYEKPASGKSYTLVNGQWLWVDPSPGSTAIVLGDGIVAGDKISAAVSEKGNITKSAGALVINIAEVRNAEKGRPAKLQGIVMVVPDIFGSQFFYITGDNAGVQIYQSKKDFPPLGVGDLVEVTGTVSEASGIKRINTKNSDAIDILSLGNSFEALPLNLDEISEENRGALVLVEGEITELKSTFMYIDDGVGEIKIYFKKNTKIDKKLLKEGERVQVTGILEKTSSEWQVWPRSNEDVEKVVEPMVPGEVLGEKIETPQAEENEFNKYLVVASLGVAGLLFAFLAKFKGPALVGFIRKTGDNSDKKD